MKRRRLVLLGVCLPLLGGDCDALTSKVRCVSPLAVSATVCLADCDPQGVEWRPDLRQGRGCGWCHCIDGVETPLGPPVREPVVE